ncbi:hypothetical protein ACIBCN_28595 [Nocardia sp. NPDC051052]|uniref:hypothetical protein n=1 Tax=Nocardia sp. NPDC051052 TaxID=3364322 RepID=UPI0037BC7A23
MPTRITVALAGRAGARLAAQLGLPGSRDTLLRLIRTLPDPPVGAITVQLPRRTMFRSNGTRPPPAVPTADAGPAAPTPAAAPVADDKYTQLRARTRKRFDAVHRLNSQGMGLRTIATELGLDRKPVRCCATAASPDEVIAAATSRVAVLDGFVTHLLQRCNAGITDIATLTAELCTSSVTAAASAPSTATCRPTAAAANRSGPLPIPAAAPKIRTVTPGCPEGDTRAKHTTRPADALTSAVPGCSPSSYPMCGELGS